MLERASSTAKTTCGQLSVAFDSRGGAAVPGEHFAVTATVPHNCGHARLVLHVLG
jgi:hypothetical protein